MEPNDIQRDMIDVDLHALGTENARLRKVNAALLEALERLVMIRDMTARFTEVGRIKAYSEARAAIAQARGGGK